MVRLVPQLESEAIPPPPKFAVEPRICCIFCIEVKDDATKVDLVRTQYWSVPNLKRFCSNVEKGYSRAIAKQAIPLLVNDINRLKNPQDVRCKFQMMIGVPIRPGIAQPMLDISDVDISGDDNGELFRQRIKRFVNGLS